MKVSPRNPGLLLLAALTLAFPWVMLSTNPLVAESKTSIPTDRQISGTWKLVSLYEEDAKGEDINQFGDRPVGDFMAGPGGNFSLQIMSLSARRYTPKAPSCVSAVGLIDAITYFGTYSIDRRHERLSLHIENCLFRKCDGANLTLSIKTHDDTMEWISAGEPSATGVAYSRILWRRACCNLQH